jgi:hypothetical protein
MYLDAKHPLAIDAKVFLNGEAVGQAKDAILFAADEAGCRILVAVKDGAGGIIPWLLTTKREDGRLFYYRDGYDPMALPEGVISYQDVVARWIFGKVEIRFPDIDPWIVVHCRDFQAAPLQNEAEYDAALAEVGTLMDAEEGTPGFTRLNALTDRIHEYESIHCPIDPPTPEAVAEYEREKRGR